MTIGSFLLLTVFPALLPPASGTNLDDEEEGNTSCNTSDFEFYECLGLERGNRDKITITDIRKAYRKKSLQLHPDKVAQRREHEKEADLKKQYEMVQEAYNCLQDVKNRSIYHDYGCSVKRYRFVTGPSPELYNPVSLVENLSKSSVGDKTRIILAVAVVLLSMLIQPILIAMKINNNPQLDDVTWIVILLPWLIFHGLAILLHLAILVATKCNLFVAFTVLEMTAWYAGIIVLASEWDESENKDETNWHKIAVPFYAAVFIRIVSTISYIKSLREIQSRMISMDYLEKKECNGCPLEDLPEEKQIELSKKYIVIHVNEETCEAVRQVYKEQNANSSHTAEEEEKIEEQIKVQTSDEFRAVQSQISKMHSTITAYIMYCIAFIILVSFKLTPNSKIYDASWWTIFTPIWIAVGIPFLCSCYVCSCYSADIDGDDDLQEGPGPDETKEEGGAKSNGSKQCAETPEDGTTVISNVNLERSMIVQDEVKKSDIENQGEKSEVLNWVPAPSLRQIDPDFVDISENSFNGSLFASVVESKNPEESKVSDESKEQDPAATVNLSTAPIEEANNRNDTNHQDSPFQPAPSDEDDDDDRKDEATAESLRVRGTACISCCWHIFQIIMLCLVVGKLEADYDSTSSDDDGYNAFWILFPIFFITGIVLCCCSCLIYCSDGHEINRRKEEHEHEHGAAVASASSEPNAFVIVVGNDESKNGNYNGRVGDVNEGEQQGMDGKTTTPDVIGNEESQAKPNNDKPIEDDLKNIVGDETTYVNGVTSAVAIDDID